MFNKSYLRKFNRIILKNRNQIIILSFIISLFVFPTIAKSETTNVTVKNNYKQYLVGENNLSESPAYMLTAFLDRDWYDRNDEVKIKLCAERTLLGVFFLIESNVILINILTLIIKYI
jgi:hypothetical protein